MTDIVAQLEVISKETGCVLDISAIVDLSVCPRIDVTSHRPHKVEEKDDYICVTPTEDKNNDKKRCDKKTCYEVREEVCRKPTVAIDLQILVILGLLSEEDLEKYLKTTGAMGEDDTLDMEDEDVKDEVKMDPLLSVGVGEDDSILDLDVGGEDGLLTLGLLGNDVLTLGGEGGLLNLNLLRRRSNKGLIDIDVGGQRDEEEADIDIDVLTHPRLLRRAGGKLLDVDVGGEKDDEEAAIDVDLLTTSKKNGGKGTSGKGKGTKGLLDVDVGGEKDDDEAAIDVDLLTTPKKNNGDENNNGGNGGNGNHPGKGNNGGKGHYNGGYLSHYQPICKKGFRKGHRNNAERCHAKDVNHCLAICHSQSAILTIEADVQVGDIANIQLCAAIEFDSSIDGDNCRYFVAPETEPCHEEELEENDNCVSFVRN